MSLCCMAMTASAAMACRLWWRRWGSNPRPRRCERRALPAELRPRYGGSGGSRTLMGLASHRPLKPARMPIPPRSQKMVAEEGIPKWTWETVSSPRFLASHFVRCKEWLRRRDSNPQFPAYEAGDVTIGPLRNFGVHGASCRTRTDDPRFTRAVLYLLS